MSDYWMETSAPMKSYWMGEPIDQMPREKLLEIIDQLGRELAELRANVTERRHRQMSAFGYR